MHFVVARFGYSIEQVMRVLKQAATESIISEGRHPLAEYRRRDGSIPTLWAKECWTVFIEEQDEVLAAIEYVRDNPIKEGKRVQDWSFVRAYSTM